MAKSSPIRAPFVHTLRARVLLIVAVAIVPMAVWATLAAAISQRDAIARAEKELLATARVLAARHESIVNETRALLRALGHAGPVASGDARACSKLLRETVEQAPMLENMVVTAPNGQVWCSGLPLPAYPINLADRAWFEQAIKTGTFVVGDYQVARISGNVIVVHAYPYVGPSGIVDWVISGALDLNWAHQQAALAGLQPDTQLFLLDSRGVILVDYPRGERVGQSVLDTGLEPVLAARAASVFRSKNLGDGTFLFASIPLFVQNRAISHVVVGTPIESVLASSRAELYRTLTTIAVLGFIAAAFAIGLADRLLTRRTDRLIAAATRLEFGDLAARTGLSESPDEIGRLARAFDRMAAALEHSSQEQRKEEERWRDLADATLDGVLVHDGETILDVNRRLAEIFGYEPGELRGAALSRLAPDDHAAMLAAYARNQGTNLVRLAGRRKDGAAIPIEMSGGQAYYAGAARNVLSIRDVSREAALRSRVQWLSQLAEQSPSSVMITNTDGVIEYVNARFSETSLYPPEEAIGKRSNLLNSGLNPPEVFESLWRTITAGNVWRGEILNRRKDGSLYWEYEIISPIRDDGGRITHYAAMKEDVTLRKEYEERLLRQAHFDELTGLPNRLLARDRLNGALARAGRDDTKVAVIMVDLDGFKKINDTLGHAVGDSLLNVIATRLKGGLREADSVARLGGDEFLVVLPDLKQDLSADIAGRKILFACAQPATIGTHELFVSASLGIALYPDDGDSPDILIRNAETAMYEAKRAGKNRMMPFRREAGLRIVRHVALETGLRRALDRNELSLVYQPIMDLATGAVAGAEALLRWKNPELGDVSPAEFIPIAEEADLIQNIGDWVLKESCRAAAELRRRNGRPLFMSINLSARQMDRRIVDQIAEALDTHSLPPDFLKVEVTETLLMRDVPLTLEIMESMRNLGVGLSLDDFGTGYSSLSYIKKSPFSMLKIDQIFIRGVLLDARDRRLFSGIVAMARSLGLDIAVEGIETSEHLWLARGERCSYAQGYLFSPPMPFGSFVEFLDRKTVISS
ncbi:MAG: EAL domain-containing protein [Rhodospirillales bacterium]|nr:EAL domain-containing protein [Rhodospirillales bacterium]